MTTTQQLTMSVLTAPLAQIDRRTLSQAWYSALQLARPQHYSAQPIAAKRQSVNASPMQIQHVNGDDKRSAVPAQLPKIAHNDRAAKGMPSPDRRAARSSLARRIERQFLHPMKRPTSATLRFADGSRCRVSLVQRDGIVHLIVVTPARHAHALREALDQARFALARSGIRIACEVRERQGSDVD